MNKHQWAGCTNLNCKHVTTSNSAEMEEGSLLPQQKVWDERKTWHSLHCSADKDDSHSTQRRKDLPVWWILADRGKTDVLEDQKSYQLLSTRCSLCGQLSVGVTSCFCASHPLHKPKSVTEDRPTVRTRLLCFDETSAGTQDLGILDRVLWTFWLNS